MPGYSNFCSVVCSTTSGARSRTAIVLIRNPLSVNSTTSAHCSQVEIIAWFALLSKCARGQSESLILPRDVSQKVSRLLPYPLSKKPSSLAFRQEHCPQAG